MRNALNDPANRSRMCCLTIFSSSVNSSVRLVEVTCFKAYKLMAVILISFSLVKLCVATNAVIVAFKLLTPTSAWVRSVAVWRRAWVHRKIWMNSLTVILL